ncbi:hypothetical protein RISK_004701 [Rhodopirellula islandica]|uniref:Uncharacterized protein n=1 Tax=Rhodopirellula islandica TaxID=595434 RepID=A0A0J1ED03_RHOIS|nr:hypothetical protein RISK_004701 [Rhodopirellula islandica]
MACDRLNSPSVQLNSWARDRETALFSNQIGQAIDDSL